MRREREGQIAGTHEPEVPVRSNHVDRVRDVRPNTVEMFEEATIGTVIVDDQNADVRGGVAYDGLEAGGRFVRSIEDGDDDDGSSDGVIILRRTFGRLEWGCHEAP